MLVEDLVKACVDRINYASTHGFKQSDAKVMLVSKKGLPFPRKGFPRPELACDGPNGKVYWYPAMNLLAALAAHDLVEVQFDRKG